MSKSRALQQSRVIASGTAKVGRINSQVVSGAMALALPSTVRVRAVELLAIQPRSLTGLSRSERGRVVVTAVADTQGNEYPISHFGDAMWDLASEFEAKNKSPYTMRITWPTDIPQVLVEDAKAVFYCALRGGRGGAKSWSASAVVKAAQDSFLALRHIASRGVKNFSELKPLHLSDYICSLRKSIQSSSIRSRLKCVDLVWEMPKEIFFPLQQHPWAGSSLSHACGDNEDDGPVGRTGKTPIIPVQVQRRLFEYCESRLKEADDLFRRREAGEISNFSYELTSLRDAILYLVQITSGMRNSESMGLQVDCWRIELRNGQTYHWIRTREIKTKQGDVEFLVPPETIAALQVLQRYAEPYQAHLAQERVWLDGLLNEDAARTGQLSNGMSTARALQRLNRIQEIGQYLFLSMITLGDLDNSGMSKRIDVMSVFACNLQLNTLARAAGVKWKLANHQCRRTFGFNVANSRLGNMGLIFLKWQLKHASMSWTQLYASNPYQDQGLYRDLEDQLVEARVRLLENWLNPDTHITGGAGKKLLQTRATAVPNREMLLRHTAEVMDIRSTGHAWCLSGTRGCGGQGLYDPTMCGGCSQAIIDSSQVNQWQMIHLDNLRLAALVDCGPAVALKAERAIKRSEEVLADLGVALPTLAQADAYQNQVGKGGD